jgi:hypothetical protein
MISRNHHRIVLCGTSSFKHDRQASQFLLLGSGYTGGMVVSSNAPQCNEITGSIKFLYNWAAKSPFGQQIR